MATIGTCGNCKGPVQVPDFWGGTVPPVPTCANCGAQPDEPYGKTVKMRPRKAHEQTDVVGTTGCEVTFTTVCIDRPKYYAPKIYGVIHWNNSDS